MPSKIQIQEQLKLVDDVFHPLVIALERYEAFLERQRNGEESKIPQVASHSEGDIFDYSPETINNGLFLHRQLRVECITLHNQTVFDEDSIAKISNRYFLEDLLEWYGGRGDNIPYDEIDAFGYPIICSICQLVATPRDVRDIIETYIKELPKNIISQDDIEKALSRIIKATYDLHERINTVRDYVVRRHIRGNKKDGYERLFMSFVILFKDDVPAKSLCRVIHEFLPELAVECSSINEKTVDVLFEQKSVELKNEISNENADIPFEKIDEQQTILQEQQTDSPICEKKYNEELMTKARELYNILKGIFE